MKEINRSFADIIRRRLSGEPNFIQLVTGPRQVGKTTAVRQILKGWSGPSHYASADLPSPPDVYWLESQWDLARRKSSEGPGNFLLVLDEIQKIPRWAEVVKMLWDEDHARRTPIRVVVLGSAALIVLQGAEESLAGRFEKHYASHWSWPECREAFGWNLEKWIYFGGYPGAGPLAEDRPRWADYVAHSLIEAVLSRDVFQMSVIAKPALFRRLFSLAVQAHGQVLSFNKMMGQLDDAGNAGTLAHYLDLLSRAFLVSGLPLWSAGVARSRASSPKLIVWNNALINAMSTRSFEETRARPDLWGRLVENAVGLHILNQATTGLTLHYWRDGDREVDFVLEYGERLILIEVKSGRRSRASGLDALRARYPRATPLLIGSGGIPLETFFSSPLLSWLR